MKDGDLGGFWNLIRRDYTFVALVLSLFGLGLGQYISLPYPLILTLGLFLFSAFDAIGYESVAHSPKREDLIRYRIGQSTIQWLVFILLGLLTHWNVWVLGGYVYLWWMGVCDVLFYIMLKKEEELFFYADMSWLWWTPLGFMNKLLDRSTSGREVFYITVYSSIIWFSLWFLKPMVRTFSIMDWFK
jgi:hypothetical protein